MSDQSGRRRGRVFNFSNISKCLVDMGLRSNSCGGPRLDGGGGGGGGGGPGGGGGGGGGPPLVGGGGAGVDFAAAAFGGVAIFAGEESLFGTVFFSISLLGITSFVGGGAVFACRLFFGGGVTRKWKKKR